MKELRIGNHLVGPGHPSFLVAEIGINHNGDMALAEKMIAAAARAGATSVKFQNYRTEDFIGDTSLIYEYSSQGRLVVESQYEMFKRCELHAEQLTHLKRVCDRVGVLFHSTPTNADGVADLVNAGSPVLKNGSDYLTDLELIAAMGATGLPSVLSTGLATVEEIDDAVRAFRATGNDQLILLHCTSAYPAPPQELHMRKMVELASTFDCLTGFSDHSEGTTAAIVAIALGACWIEKHFTIDRGLPGPDQCFSSDEAEFAALVRGVRAAEAALVEAPLGPSERARVNRADFQLSCQAGTKLPAGHILQRSDIVCRRPGNGLPPKTAPSLVGRTLLCDVEAGHLFSLEDVAT